MLPIFSNTMELIKDSISGLTAIIHVAPNKYVEEYINRAVREWPIPVKLVLGTLPSARYASFNVRVRGFNYIRLPIPYFCLIPVQDF